MKFRMLKKNFDGNHIMYAPEMELPETPTVCEPCYPAVRYSFRVDDYQFFFLLTSEVGEYEEYENHPAMWHALHNIGGEEKVVAKFQKMHDKVMEEL